MGLFPERHKWSYHQLKTNAPIQAGTFDMIRCSVTFGGNLNIGSGETVIKVLTRNGDYCQIILSKVILHDLDQKLSGGPTIFRQISELRQ
jgi:hypothetical protein